MLRRNQHQQLAKKLKNSGRHASGLGLRPSRRTVGYCYGPISASVETPCRRIVQGLCRILIKGLLGFIYGVLTMAHMGASKNPGSYFGSSCKGLLFNELRATFGLHLAYDFGLLGSPGMC